MGSVSNLPMPEFGLAAEADIKRQLPLDSYGYCQWCHDHHLGIISSWMA
jgi:hypothetical protein